MDSTIKTIYDALLQTYADQFLNMMTGLLPIAFGLLLTITIMYMMLKLFKRVIYEADVDNILIYPDLASINPATGKVPITTVKNIGKSDFLSMQGMTVQQKINAIKAGQKVHNDIDSKWGAPQLKQKFDTALTSGDKNMVSTLINTGYIPSDYQKLYKDKISKVMNS